MASDREETLVRRRKRLRSLVHIDTRPPGRKAGRHYAHFGAFAESGRFVVYAQRTGIIHFST